MEWGMRYLFLMSPTPPVPAPSSVEVRSHPVAPDGAETPLPRAQHASFLGSATLWIAAFYLYCGLALVVGALAWAAIAVVGVVGIQYGGSFLLGIALGPLGGVLMAFARSLKLGRETPFRIKLSQGEAPRLWLEVRELAARLGVAAPRDISLENGVNAWVRLSGVAAGRGTTRLGVGLDLLIGLSPGEGRGVLAHEIAHAKHVKRGYQGFLMRGLVRLQRCEGTLDAIAGYEKNAKSVKALARIANAIPKRIGERAGKLIAACSRFDEFEADRVAASVCGSETMARALLATHVLDFRAERLSYRDRLLHLGRGDIAWLERELRVGDESRRLELEERALAFARRHELSTHPALPDRLAALHELKSEGDDWQPGGESSATFWLAQPGESARRLLEEVERLAAKNEQKETRELAKRMRKHAASQRAQAGRSGKNALYGVCSLVVGLMLGAVVVIGTLRERFDPSFLFTGGIAVGALVYGIWNFLPNKGGRGELAVPTYGAYRVAMLLASEDRRARRARSQARQGQTDKDRRSAEVRELLDDEQRSADLSRELRATLPTKATKNPARMAHWNERGFEFLGAADFERARLCSRLSLECERTNPRAWLVLGVCLAFEGEAGVKELVDATLNREPNFSAQWAKALSLCLENQTEAGEAFLLELSRRRPKDATIRALLGFCQSANGKAREALATRQLALRLGGQNAPSDVASQACHRFDLAQSLVALGQLDAAQSELAWLDEHLQRGIEPRALNLFALRFEWLRLHIAREDVAATQQVACELAGERDDTASVLQLADALAEAGERASRDLSLQFYERILERGHYPQAKIAVSRLHFDRDDLPLARQWILASLDTTSPRPIDARHPLNLVGDALVGLRACSPVAPQKATAFEACLDAKSWELGRDTITLLGCFEDEAQALHAAQELFGAIAPDKSVDERITITRASDEFQPKEPVSPGWADFKFE